MMAAVVRRAAMRAIRQVMKDLVPEQDVMERLGTGRSVIGSRIFGALASIAGGSGLTAPAGDSPLRLLLVVAREAHRAAFVAHAEQFDFESCAVLNVVAGHA